MFDSSFNGKLAASAELQITQLYQLLISEQPLLVTIIPVQQQSPGWNNPQLFIPPLIYKEEGGGGEGVRHNTEN